MNKKWVHLLALSGLIAISIIFLKGVITNDFVNWDDDVMILHNADLQGFDASAFFSKSYLGHYHPVTMLSYSIDFFINGLHSYGYHLHNLLLHLFNSVFVYFVIFLLTRKISYSLFCSIVFSIHPLHVESFAWISERKDVLFSFFFLLSCIFYLLNQTDKKKIYGIIIIVSFLLSLFSKAAAVTLPVVFILFDLYKGVSFRTSVIHKIPFLLISLVAGTGTYFLFKAEGNVYEIPDYTIFDRLLIPFNSLLFYLYKFFVPTNLSAAYFFPIKSSEGFDITFYISPLLILLVTLLLMLLKKHRKQVILGGVFFLVTIVLFLQIVPHGRVITADRYSYLPYIGLSFLFIYFFEHFSGKFYRYTFPALVVFIIAFFGYHTLQRIEVWNNGYSLATDIIDENPDHPIGYFNRSLASYSGFNSQKKQDLALALTDINKAIQLDSSNARSFFNRGNIHFGMQNYNDSFIDYSKSIEIDPYHAGTYCNLGLLYATGGQPDKAIKEYDKALKLEPMYADALNNLGFAYYNIGKSDSACYYWEKALSSGNLQSEGYFKTLCP